MADENTTPESTATVTPPGGTVPVVTPPPAQTPRMFTQDEVNRIAAEARDAGRRAAANAAPPAAKPAGQAPSDVVDRLDRFEAQNAILRAATRAGVQLTDEQESDLLALYAAQKPEQPGAWFERKVAAFNLKPAAPSTPNNHQSPGGAPAPHAAPANGQPVTAGGAPPAQQPVRTDKMIHELSPADQKELAARLGPIEFKNRLWKEMARVQVAVGRR